MVFVDIDELRRQLAVNLLDAAAVDKGFLPHTARPGDTRSDSVDADFAGHDVAA